MAATLQIGDRVRLTSQKAAEHITLDVVTHDTAVIVDDYSEVLGFAAFRLDRALHGSCAWEAQHLVRVKKGKPIKQIRLVPLVKENMLPSNFSPEQAETIRVFEQALEKPKGHKTVLRRTIAEMRMLGIANCVTPFEVEKLQRVLPVQVNPRTHEVIVR